MKKKWDKTAQEWAHKKKFVRNRENGTEMLAARQNAHIFFCMLLFFISNSFKAFFSKSIYSKEFFSSPWLFLYSFSFFSMDVDSWNFFIPSFTFVTVDFEQIERFFITNSSNNHDDDDDDDRDKKSWILRRIKNLFDLIASLNSTEKGHNT